MARKLFGTDGIRGLAGQYPLDPGTVHAVGAALGAWCQARSSRPEVVMGMDTRESGVWIAAQVAGGLAREGIRVRFAGVVTTPGVAYLTSKGPFVAGVMISASHNPYQDNGIKVFSHSGYKLPDEEEHALERVIFRLRDEGIEPQPASLAAESNLDESYLEFLASTLPCRLEGWRVVLDCGHGAAHRLAPALLRRLGAHVHGIGCSPDGRNINVACGALHLEPLRHAVLETGAHAGFAFDGDADRCIAVTSSGKVADGDTVLLICARHLLKTGALSANGGRPLVVATVMSNLGLEKALASLGVAMMRTPVGDKYVLEEMLRQGAVLGGEQSGHVIFLRQATTGDGLLTALRVLEVMAATGMSLDELAEGMEVYPQKLVNVRINTRRPLDELPSVRDAVLEAERSLGAGGRVLVRFSGTEPLARVMVEGPSAEAHAERIAAAIRAELSDNR